MKAATHFRELLVYQGALALVMEVWITTSLRALTMPTTKFWLK